MPNVLMPRLADSMEEGTILQWLVEPGALVSRGQDLVEVETDKASVVYAAEEDGPLAILAAEGDTCAVGALIATIGEPSPVEPETAPAPQATASPPPPPAAPAVTPAPAPDAGGPGGQKASPVARRLADEHGVDVATLTGSGPRGRVLKADVVAAVGADGHAPAPDPLSPAEPSRAVEGAKGRTTVERPSRVQQVVARRMAEARATVPDFALTVDVDMEQAVALRAEIKRAAPDGAAVPSYNDMVVKACGLALRAFPRVNASYVDGAFQLHSRVNVGVAVAAPDALVVPTVFDADTRPLGDVAATTRRLAERVRSNEIAPPELAGATFTVSNLGMLGIAHFTAIVNAPQAAILAVGAMEPRVVVRDDEIVARNLMTITLSCDHRIVNGADGAGFLARVRALLEAPLLMLVG